MGCAMSPKIPRDRAHGFRRSGKAGAKVTVGAQPCADGQSKLELARLGRPKNKTKGICESVMFCSLVLLPFGLTMCTNDCACMLQSLLCVVREVDAGSIQGDSHQDDYAFCVSQ